MVYYNLKALIKAIRACKTLADERECIVRESASIRSSIKEEDSYARYNNVAKLLYIHMLGYPAHFGQIECLKLVASPRFTDKRLGYLGIMLLLDENQEVLTLVTNSLKNDMNSHMAPAVALALHTFANIASEEMARDLAGEVERCLGSSNAYIRKKAALAALRVLARCPDLLERFAPRAPSLLADRNHGVLLTGTTLIADMARIGDLQGEPLENVEVAPLVRTLKGLLTSGYSPEYDVGGVTDPFLQIKVLRLLRTLGRDDAAASEAMNDVLAQVATSTEGTKNVGNAVLYEATRTILDIDADAGLRVLAINILGKFLGNRDNNIRYVALNMLLKVVAIDTNAVQRHRQTVLECLRDGDVSIRRRALELSYALVNVQNVRAMVRELLAFLEVADTEFKSGLTTQICAAAQRFAPNRRWHVDTVIRVLRLAGNHVREDVLAHFVALVVNTPDLHAYCASKLYASLRADLSQEGLTLAAVWVIGEFADILLNAGAFVDDEESDAVVPVETSAPSASDVVELMEKVLDSPYVNNTIRSFVVTAATKLSARFGDPTLLSRLEALVRRFDQSIELELQQRAVEFGVLLSLEQTSRSDLAFGVLERMPPPEMTRPARAPAVANASSLLDVMGAPAATEPAAAPAAVESKRQTDQDLLADIFGSSSAPTSPPPTSKPSDDIMALFSSPAPSAAAPPPAAPSPAAPSPAASSPVPAASPSSAAELTAYDRNGLKVTFSPQRDRQRSNVINILARFYASSDSNDPVEGVNFQAAVPKSMKLQMLAASSTTVTPGEPETQQLRVMAPPNTAVRLRLRISFSLSGQSFQDQTDFAFDQAL